MNDTVEKRIQDVLGRNLIKVHYIFEENCVLGNNVSAEYKEKEDTIVFYPENILDNCNRDLSLEDYVELILCHELGHRNDNKLKSEVDRKEKLLSNIYETNNMKEKISIAAEIGQVNLDNEKRAYEIGKRYISSNLTELFEEMQSDNIFTTLINNNKIVEHIKSES